MQIKKYIRFCVAALLGAFVITGCSDEYNSFVDSEEKVTGYPSSVLNITSEELPGQIKLSWDIPADSNFYFLKITYFDHLSGTEKSKVSSVSATLAGITSINTVEGYAALPPGT